MVKFALDLFMTIILLGLSAIFIVFAIGIIKELIEDARLFKKW